MFAVILLSMVTACSSGSNSSQPVTEQLGPVGPVPAGLEKFYGQTLTWGDCAPFATTNSAKTAFAGRGLQCARLSVPLDYAKPESTGITLGLLRQKASKPEQRIGSLVLNPGGPGASGMEAAAGLAPTVSRGALGERFDLIGFDPRGIGASTPQIRCLTGPERDEQRAENLTADVSPAGVAKQEAEAKEFGTKCSQRTEHGTEMLANLGSREVAKDLDVLRSALGEPKLNYLGFSYGTRIGYTYAEAFAGNVRAMVLDGAVDPQQDPVASVVAQGEGFGRAFGEFVTWCTARQDCALGANPAGATTAFQNLVRPLIDTPVQVGDGRRLSYSDATIAAIQALYSEQLWEYLNTGLTELTQGTGTTLMVLADQYNERDRFGNYSSTQDAFTAIRCIDDPRITDKQKILEAENRYEQVAAFLDDGKPNAAAFDECAFWPAPNTSEPHQPSAQGLPPVLVISTTGDPATPYQAGVNLAKSLNGGLLTVEGNNHTAFLQGNACVDEATINYLTTGALPAEGTRCSSQ